MDRRKQLLHERDVHNRRSERGKGGSEVCGRRQGREGERTDLKERRTDGSRVNRRMKEMDEQQKDGRKNGKRERKRKREREKEGRKEGRKSEERKEREEIPAGPS